MNFDPRLYVEIVPLDNGRSPQPHPVNDGRFDPDYAYKLLGVYNPSETSECYLMLANLNREIWFIPQRHTRAYRLLDGDALFVRKAPPSPLYSGEKQADSAAARERVGFSSRHHEAGPSPLPSPLSTGERE